MIVLYIKEMRTVDLLNELKRKFNDCTIYQVEQGESFLTNITVGKEKECLIQGCGRAVVIVLSNPLKPLVLDDHEKLAQLQAMAEQLRK